MAIQSDADLEKSIAEAELLLLQRLQWVEETRYIVFGLKWVRDQRRAEAPLDFGDIGATTGQA